MSTNGSSLNGDQVRRSTSEVDRVDATAEKGSIAS
jgi:hypothetical protein